MKKAISKINPSRYAKKLHISYIWLIAVLLLLAVGVICSGAKVYKYSPILSVVSYSLAANQSYSDNYYDSAENLRYEDSK